jgi:murein DD-endopeptidase MepM/ murein hydrolase activator NlpD
MEKRGQIQKFMKSKLAKVILVTLVIFIIALIFKVNPASSSSIDEKRSEVDRLQNQIDHYQGLANEKAGQIESLEAQVAKMNAEIKVTELNIEKTQKKVNLTQAEINETKEKIKEKEKELAYQKSVLDEALRVIYEEGNAGFLESFLTAETLADLMDRTEYLDAVSNKIEVTMEKIEGIKTELLAKKEDLEEKKTELTSLIDQQKAINLALNEQKREKNLLLAETKGEEAEYEKLLNQRLTQFQDSNSELKRMEEAIRRGLGGDAPSATGFIWPMHGYISVGFGECGCEAYFCGLCHWGIDIVNAAGTPIVASKGGKAYKKYDPGGYGIYVSIDHADSFSTIYGHMQIYASGYRNGSYIERGTVIGYEGSTGFSTGPHLHFEVRYKGVPTDPRRYLP